METRHERLRTDCQVVGFPDISHRSRIPERLINVVGGGVGKTYTTFPRDSHR